MARHVREPVQVYLDPQDRDLLEDLARETKLPRAELLRRGLRQLGDHVLGRRAPGWSLDVLDGMLGSDANRSNDLAARHDQYLAKAYQARRAPRKKRSR